MNVIFPIEIPIYEIKSGNLSVPITLSYHGGGIKVEQDATWVGLGWNLDFGGSIVRTVNGVDDKHETYNEHFDAEYVSRNELSKNDQSRFSVYNWCVKNKKGYTYMPDLYSYKIGSNSGTFFTKGNKGSGGFDFDTICPTNYFPMKISKGKFNHREIVMPNGVKYQFGQTETTNIITERRVIDPYISAWYVTKIISPNSDDEIDYTYQNSGRSSAEHATFYTGTEEITRHLIYFNSNNSKSVEQPQPSSYEWKQVPNQKASYYIPQVQTVKPEYIIFNGGRLSFILDNREDFDGNDYYRLKKLSRIDIQEETDKGIYKTIKSINFHYSYFIGCGRLKLDSITENGTGNLYLNSKLIAGFDYYDQDKYMPKHDSKSKDYWGYYNGKGNSDYFPLIFLPSYTGFRTFGGADRTPKPEFIKYGSLKSILYPTGGSTEYVWEINRINTDKPVYHPKEQCSLSFKSTTSYNHDSTPSVFDEEIRGKSITIECGLSELIEMDISVNCNSTNSLAHNKYDKFTIEIDNVEKYSYHNTYEGKVKFNLPEGRHVISLRSNCSNISGSIYFVYSKQEKQIHNSPFAGLRIREIKDFDNDGSLLLRRTYDYTDSLGNSSGYLTTEIDDNISFTDYSTDVSMEDILTNSYLNITKRYYVYSDMKEGPKDNNFSYEFVTENVMDGMSGNILSSVSYQYQKCKDVQVSRHTPLQSMSHVRSNIIRESVFDFTNQKKTLKKETINFYSLDNRICDEKVGFILYPTHGFDGLGSFEHFCRFEGYSISQLYVPYNYSYSSNWLHIDSTIVKEFFDNGSCSLSKTYLNYGSHIHLQPTTTLNCVGKDTIKNVVLYPSDISNGNSKMVEANMLTYPIISKTYLLTKDGSEFISGIKNDYNGQLMLSRVSKYMSDVSFCRLYDYKYNEWGRLIEFTDNNNIITSIVWDEKQLNPLYIAKGIGYNAFKQSIELGMENNDSLKMVQIKSFTYKPLMGVSSVVQPNCFKTIFDYDGLGRLKQISDKYGTRNRFIYNYSHPLCPSIY